MKSESIMLMKAAFSILAVSYGWLILKFFLEKVLKDRWLKSLDKDGLLKLENQLDTCLEAAAIDPSTPAPIEDIIRSQKFFIREKHFIPFREAYTICDKEASVFVKRSLPSDRRNFALTHELMHIIYKPEEIVGQPAGRSIHSMFRLRDETEQERDYMAASFLLRRDSFWKELTDANYFECSPSERKEFVYRSARKHNVEPSMVFRRISELNVMRSA